MHFFLASTLVVLTLTINAGVVGRVVSLDAVGIAARSRDYDDVDYPSKPFRIRVDTKSSANLIVAANSERSISTFQWRLIF